ncbi:hypothetical protein ABRZ04_05215 [Castellaniella ginsengisoli]|uniref:Uncharacterized protein n=1 Tax=Castellaniella ginsengisoli TaxID=546114 RepID=A0AB39D384_9BURK
MPKVSTIQTNFTAGEISPKVRGRVDVTRYQNGAALLENCLVDIYGGVRRAPGTEFIGPVADMACSSLLIPFVFNRDAAYHLEFSDGVMRVIRAGAGIILKGGVPYELTIPYTQVELRELRYVQAADTMFIAHPDHPIHVLRRLAEDAWAINPAPFSVLPFGEIGHVFETFTLTLSDATVGTGRTATSSGSAFLASDVGRRITYLTGVAVVTAVSSGTAVTVEITSPFPGTAIDAGEWVLEDSPQTTLTPSAKGTVGQSITLTLSADGWRSVDVGKFVEVNKGMVQITAVSSGTSASGVVKQDLDSAVAAQAGAWKLQSSVWGGLNGYPSAVTLNEQRLIAGGTVKYPQGVWGSCTGLYYDFTQGENDTDGFFFNVDSDQVSLVEHLASVRAIITLTAGGEFTVTGGVEKPITPTNAQAKSQSVYGSNAVRPVRVGDEIIFVQRAGRKVRAMGYRAESDSYVAPNLTTLAEHITESGVVQMAYQQEPDSVVWAVLANGKMAALTIDRDEGVIAWTSHKADGFYESVSAAPAGDRDEIMAVVRREVNGQTVRYIERLNPDYTVHAGIMGESESGDAVWGGLTHLEGETVTVLADGVPQGMFTVSGGEITLPRVAHAVQIGLPVIPRIKTLPPEIMTPTGTAQSSKMRGHKYSLLVLNTTGAVVNGERITFRRFGSELLDKPPPMYSGWASVGDLGWHEGEMPIEITQPDPLPFHLLALVRHWTTNE